MVWSWLTAAKIELRIAVAFAAPQMFNPAGLNGVKFTSLSSPGRASNTENRHKNGAPLGHVCCCSYLQ